MPIQTMPLGYTPMGKRPKLTKALEIFWSGAAAGVSALETMAATAQHRGEDIHATSH